MPSASTSTGSCDFRMRNFAGSDIMLNSFLSEPLFGDGVEKSEGTNSLGLELGVKTEGLAKAPPWCRKDAGGVRDTTGTALA